MKKNKALTTSLFLALTAFSSVSLAGCFEKPGTTTEEKMFFYYSIGTKSGRTELQVGDTDTVEVYDNGVDTAGRSYTFQSSNTSVATVDSNGKITALAPGKFNIIATETKDGDMKQLAKQIEVLGVANKANGGFNYAGAATTEALTERAKILGKLEKYSMDKHLTGITLFDNGGFIKYSDRVKLPGGDAAEYVTGYGFGLLTEGRLEGTLPGEEGQQYPEYYHTAISQDSLKINAYNATGSQVSDLASYITSSYWGTKLKGTTDYEWYPVLAAKEVKVPTVTGYKQDKTPELSYAATATENARPIPMEEENDLGLYKKWRVYVKVDGVNGEVLKYHTMSQNNKTKTFDNRGVALEDYEFIYKFLLTGSNAMIRGSEMANDTSYGIKGAQRYYNDTKKETDITKINNTWNKYKNEGKLGIATGTDENGGYIDIELINPIDSFTAMYTLSSSLVSPMPEAFFVGENAIASTMKQAAEIYGTFNNGADDAILDYTLCCGPYKLEKWTKNQLILFKRNDDWFEIKEGRYNIKGVWSRVIDTSQDTEKVWKQFNQGNIDAAGIPSKKVKEEKDKDGVYQTKGDSTFKLNVNSATQEQWNSMFGPNGTVKQNSNWTLKPWMSNDNFLNGLFYAIDRAAFAEKRGVTPSINYFSDAYMWDPENGKSYNDTQFHKDAIAGYSPETYGYDYDKAVDSFRAAVNELTKTTVNGKPAITLGTADNPTIITIHIRWMYLTDVKEYGEDIASYFEKAFNDPAVCGKKVQLKVEQEGVQNWEDVYNVWMMKGQFDLGFGAISGNTLNPLNFLEVLKSDNSSGFTLNWGPDTAKVDTKQPIVYDGKEWSFDGLWEVADHGGIVKEGEKIKPVNYCYLTNAKKLDEDKIQKNLYEGFKMQIPVSFAEFEGENNGGAEFSFNRIDCYIYGRGNVTMSEDKAIFKKKSVTGYDYDVIELEVDAALAQEINEAIITANGFDKLSKKEAWQENPFIISQYNSLFSFEFYYNLRINNGSSISTSYIDVAMSNE